MNLRKQAEGKTCTLQIPGVCNGDESTTVLAHIRSLRIESMLRRAGVRQSGGKPEDEIGIEACSECHEFIGDGGSGKMAKLANYKLNDLERELYELAELYEYQRDALAVTYTLRNET